MPQKLHRGDNVSNSGGSRRPRRQAAPRPRGWPRSRRPSGRLDKSRRWLGGKSIWDWFDLASKLAIPVVIAGATIGFGWWQSTLADRQHQSDQQLAGRQHQSDQQLAQDQQNATILQTYISNIQSLLINNNLTRSKPGDEVRQLARVQTLITLRRLDAGRNIVLLRFLQNADLIGMQDSIIDLSGANLSGANLSGANLSGINLADTDLTDAILKRANLSGANLSGATLSGADLSGAYLSGAYLGSAALTGANMNGANLANATLTDAVLYNAHLDGAILTNALLNSSSMPGAQLNGADLSGANLVGADLHGINLTAANLSYADLIAAANLNEQQLSTVYSCANAKLPTGWGCPRTRMPPVTLTYWYTESSVQAPEIKKLVRQFEDKNKGITVNAVQRPYFQTPADFATAVEEGKAPDVLLSYVGIVDQFAAQGYLLNIDPYISRDNLSDYLAAQLSYDFYNGHLYGLPQTTDFLALLYNKAELARAGITSPPETMADFEADAVKVVQSKAAPYGFETDGTGGNVLPFLWAFGGGMLDPHNNILVNNAGSVNGLKFLLKLQNTDKVMPAPSNAHFSIYRGGMVSDFMSGKTAMIFDGPYDISGILTDSGFKSNPGNLGITGIPTCPAGISTCHAGQTGSPLGGQSYVISAGTKHPFEAYKFIEFMSSADSQSAIARANHTLPTRRSAYQENGVSSDRFISKFFSLMPTAVATPAIPQNQSLFDALDPNIATALYGYQSPVAALNAVADAWKRLLAGS